jgi:hypothetical protein
MCKSPTYFGLFRIWQADYCSRRWWTLSSRSGDLNAYDAKKCQKALRRRAIKSRIARKGNERREKLEQHRWVVERTLSWLNRYRRLKIRYERRADITRRSSIWDAR